MYATSDMSTNMSNSSLCHQFLPKSESEDFWSKFMLAYLPIHKAIVYPVIVFGLISNAMLMAVLTRKKMVSPSNTLLIGISIFDTTTLIIYSFVAVPTIMYESSTFQFNYWFVLLLPPYLIYRYVRV